MIGRSVLVDGPDVEPVSATEAKTHMRIDGTTEDTYIGTLIKVARQYCETATCRALVTQTRQLILDGWPSGKVIELPYPPLQSVTSVKYTDTDGTEYTLSTDDYSVDTSSMVGRVVLDYSKTWPSTVLATNNPIVIEYEAGYGDEAADVPQALRHGILIDVANLYEHRETVVTGTMVTHLPTVDRLYALYRVVDIP